VQLYQSGKAVTSLRVWKGTVPEVKAGFLADRYVTLPRGQSDKLALTLVAQERLLAPVTSGQKVVHVGPT
jgi:D-alanyl-D-alanine carboxypeptidase (penicillin-binding protein 5/6)